MFKRYIQSQTKIQRVIAPAGRVPDPPAVIALQLSDCRLLQTRGKLSEVAESRLQTRHLRPLLSSLSRDSPESRPAECTLEWFPLL